MTGFVRTATILDQILTQKAATVAAQYAAFAADPALADQLEQAAHTAPPVREFVAALHRETVALIAEVKHASPSKGVLIDPFDPAALGVIYATNGAAAISVLTDAPFFRGHLDHLRTVRAVTSVPVLRKDFILDAVQITEARAAAADAVLLIAAALTDEQLAALHRAALKYGLAALVEVHNDAELDRALTIGAALIGVNNRDLHTFREDLSITERLARRLPSGVTLVAESAIRSADDVRRMGDAGARAVLVGEGLVKAADIGAQVRLFSGQPRRVTLNAREERP